MTLMLMRMSQKYNVYSTKAGFKPDQARDEDGKWTSGSNELSEDEKWAIDKYTAGYHSELNAKYRGDEVVDKLADELDGSMEQMEQELNSGLEKLEDYYGSTYRGMALWKGEDGERYNIHTFINDLKDDGMITFPGYLSTSENINEARDFAREMPHLYSRIILEMEGLTGKDVSEFSRFPDEKEVLFGKGTTWEVENIDENYGDYRIRLRQI